MQFDPNLVKRIYGEQGCKYYVKNLQERKSKAIAIVGPGRNGKDTVATAITRLTRLQYNGTCSLAAAELVYKTFVAEKQATGEGTTFSFRQFYNNRHDFRDYFFHCLNAFRDYEPLVVPALALQSSDLLVGVRSKRELEAARPYISKCVWVSKTGEIVDNTLEFTIDDCKYMFGDDFDILNNNWSISNLVARVLSLLNSWGVTITLAPKEIPYLHHNGLVIGQ